MNEIKKTKTGTETGTENGSPTTRPCTTIALSGTADEQSTAGNIKSPDNERAVISVISLTALTPTVPTALTTFTALAPRSPNAGVGLSLRGGQHAA